MKKIFLILMLLMFFSINVSALGKDVKIYVNGNLIQFEEGKPFVDSSGRTLVALRFITETLGAKVSWDESVKKVTVDKDGNSLILYIGRSTLIKKSINIPNKLFKMDTIPVIRDGRTMVPIRFISENFNCSVTWDESTRTVDINSLPVGLSNHELESQSHLNIEGENVVFSELINKPSINQDLIVNPDKYKLQILYTRIKRTKGGVDLIPHHFNVDDNNYFYPASAVKLASVLVSTDKLNNLGYSITDEISSSDYGRSSFKTLFEKIFYYSDNPSYNNLFDFIGRQEFNQILSIKGFEKSKLLIRYDTQQKNQVAPKYSLISGGSIVYTEPERMSIKDNIDKNINGLLVGNGYKNSSGTLIREPKSFSESNMMSINDLQLLLKQVFFRDTIPFDKRFNLTTSDIDYIKNKMKGNGTGTLKYFVCGGSSKIPDGITIHNKIGIAYGFLTDNAYIIDSQGNEFMLTATIYCNSDGILNDDKYDYYTIGLPFLKNLGNTFLQYTRYINDVEKMLN